MCAPDAPAPPDYSPIAEAQKELGAEQMKLMREQFDWAKQTYAENKATTAPVVDAFLETLRRNNESAAADRARYEEIYQPLEDDLATDAQSYASEDRRALEMGRAESRVAQQFQAARINAQRELESFGVDPSSTRFAALDLGARVQEAAAKAAAANQASQMVDATGRALRSEALNIGRGYPGQVAGTYSTALQSGTGAVNSNLATTASGASTMGTAPQYAAGANSAYSGAANTMNMGYQNQLAGFQAQQNSSSGLGALGGLVLGGMWGTPTTGATVGSKLLGFAGGGAVDPGAIPGMAPDGGAVPKQVSPTSGKAIDDVSAKLSVGEFILPEDVTRWYGEEKLHKMIVKAREGKQALEIESGAVPTVTPQGNAPRPQAIPM